MSGATSSEHRQDGTAPLHESQVERGFSDSPLLIQPGSGCNRCILGEQVQEFMGLHELLASPLLQPQCSLDHGTTSPLAPFRLPQLGVAWGTVPAHRLQGQVQPLGHSPV